MIWKFFKFNIGLKFFPINFRIGINSGSMLAGNMGSKEKMEYTVVGDSVNLASRLCSIAKTDQIVVSNEFYNQRYIRQRVLARPHIPMKLRGVEEMVETYLVRSLAENYKDRLSKQFRLMTKSDNG